MNENEIIDNSFEEFENNSENLTDKEIFSKIINFINYIIVYQLN